ncbi:MAG: beta-lactamase family protein [Verrucomicrobiae bacterium]|nr:beta-lactamase family protein [Verrucomicrobiae bacterium]
MKQPFYKSLAILVLLSPIAFIASGHAQTAGAHRGTTDRLAKQTFERQKFPGLAVGVLHKGELTYLGYGYSDIAQKIPIDPRYSKFRIGSVSKPLTAAALMRLVERDVIDLDASITKYYSKFPRKGWEITSRQLAGNMSGIRHYRGGSEPWTNISYPSVSEGLSIFKNDPLEHKPGIKFTYSTYGWSLLSAVMEGAAKSEFLPLMDSEVFKPLKMKNTSAEFRNRIYEKSVTFYRPGGEIWPPVDNSYKWAGGGFLSTAEDLLLFGKAHLQPGYLKKQSLIALGTSQRTSEGRATNYSIGWFTHTESAGRKWIYHAGGAAGGSSMIVICPQEQLVVVTLINQFPAKTENLAFNIAYSYLPK